MRELARHPKQPSYSKLEAFWMRRCFEILNSPGAAPAGCPSLPPPSRLDIVASRSSPRDRHLAMVTWGTRWRRRQPKLALPGTANDLIPPAPRRGPPQPSRPPRRAAPQQFQAHSNFRPSIQLWHPGTSLANQNRNPFASRKVLSIRRDHDIAVGSRGGGDVSRSLPAR
jgi:hypothetical protein